MFGQSVRIGFRTLLRFLLFTGAFFLFPKRKNQRNEPGRFMGLLFRAVGGMIQIKYVP